MNHKVTIKFGVLNETFELVASDKGTRWDKTRAVAIFAERHGLWNKVETPRDAYTRLRAAGLSCTFNASKEQKTPVHYCVKAPGADKTVLSRSPLSYEDARRAAVKLGGIVTTIMWAKENCWA